MTATLEPGRDYVVVPKSMSVDWIPVEQGMPDADETVMIYSPSASEPVWLGYYDGGDWLVVDGSIAEDVTAWAPMPGGPNA